MSMMPPKPPLSSEEFTKRLNTPEKRQAFWQGVYELQEARRQMYQRPLSVRGLFIATALAIAVGSLIGLVLR